MNLFKKPKALVYLKRNSIELYSAKLEAPVKHTFDANVISSLEIKNEKAVHKAVLDLTSKSGLQPCKVLVLLSEEVLFSKKIKREEGTSGLNKELKEFLDEIPFKSTKISSLNIYLEKETLVIATNRHLYETLSSGFSMNKWSVLYVVPEIILDVAPMTIERAAQLLNSVSDLRDANFLTNGKVYSEDTAHTNNSTKDVKPKSKKKLITFMSAFLLIGFFTLATLHKFNIIGLFSVITKGTQETTTVTENNKEVSFIQQESSNDTTKEEKEIKYLEQEDTSIQVLNGTGTAGLASKIQKQLLEELDFTDIAVGNSTQERSTQTQIIHSPLVSQDVLEELESLLQDNFLEVVINETTSDNKNSYDVVIITGALLTN